MNKDNAKDYLPLVQALAEGKTIQWRTDENGEWLDITNISFSTRPNCYRIKPEPNDIWVNVSPRGGFNVYHSKDDAVRFASGGAVKVAVHYREVIEE